jgi:hypothetical protein
MSPLMSTSASSMVPSGLSSRAFPGRGSCQIRSNAGWTAKAILRSLIKCQQRPLWVWIMEMEIVSDHIVGTAAEAHVGILKRPAAIVLDMQIVISS